MENEIILRLENKIDSISERIAHVESTIDSWKSSVDRFYQKDFAHVLKTINSNQAKIVEIELELAKLKTKIAVWGTIGITIGSALVNVVIKQIGG